ncbi:MAG: hypothetical protein K9N47_11735 [Prosthecobacter sp.]|uniref:hypothetical protein n=1 Tax=Prosthecobacter sp. TaxID=1965333 RepID=UPI0025EA6895|nr:hypothetical protein [Prosthecobacter sp.]MCF7786786.1 hypothetical protein [Prosthecobacter sp.]
MSELTLKWNGQSWEVSGVPESMQLRRDSTFTVEASESVFEPADAEADIRLLFPKGTLLYLPLNPTKDKLRLRQLCQTAKPRLRETSPKDLLPIVLDEDLRLGTYSRRLLDTACHFAGDDSQTFKSLNDAAQTALKMWTDRETAAIGVFKEVRFVHDAELLIIDKKRDELLDGTPLPTPGPDIVIGDLFEDQAPK